MKNSYLQKVRDHFEPSSLLMLSTMIVIFFPRHYKQSGRVRLKMLLLNAEIWYWGTNPNFVLNITTNGELLWLRDCKHLPNHVVEPTYRQTGWKGDYKCIESCWFAYMRDRLYTSNAQRVNGWLEWFLKHSCMMLGRSAFLLIILR